VSVCKSLSTGNRKRCHIYEGNKCTKCGHVTTHGKRFRAAKKAKKQ